MAQEGFKRKLTAILSADAVGYSRLMLDNEEDTVRTISSYRNVITDLVRQHSGKVIDSTGDNLLAEFASVVDAVQCAVAVQKEINSRNNELPENRMMQFRIGINLGDVIQEEERIYGDGVNIAARLEGLAEPGGICISKTTFDHIESKLPYGYEFLGDQTVKNIAKPVGAYRVLMEPRVTVAGEPKEEKRSPARRMPILVGTAAVLMLAVAIGIWQFHVRRPTVEPASKEKMAFPLPEKPSIAVLPFDNLSGDPDQEFIADGMTENVITALSYIPEIFVIARNSTFTYKGKAVKAREFFEQAASLAPGYAPVFTALGLTHSEDARHGWSESREESLLRAVELAKKGQALDDSDPNIHALWGGIYLLQRRYDQAIAEGKKSVALGPNQADPHFQLAMLLHSTGRYKEALPLVRKAMRLHPYYPFWYLWLLGSVYLRMEEYEKAVEAFKMLVVREPHRISGGHLGLAIANIRLGREEQAR